MSRPTKHGIPAKAAERILKDAGAARISPDAAIALALLLAKHGSALAHEAVLRAERSGRVTVRAEDLIPK